MKPSRRQRAIRRKNTLLSFTRVLFFPVRLVLSLI